MTTKTNSKTIFLIGLLWAFLSIQSHAQTAPPHLKYFGFTAIDCFYDDPLDASTITNYISEVDSFSNIAHMCVYDYTDNVVARTNLMNSYCVNPILHIQEIFFQIVDTLAPSGVNYDLHPNFTARWTTFMTTNSSVIDPAKIGCFYVADEPFWNGISLSDMDTVCALLKNAFPTIPLLMVEAYTTVDSMQVPQAMDWVGFDRYGTFDPQFDPVFLENLDTLKSRLSSPNQKIILIIDDQWFPEYLTYLGWTQDTMADVVQNYYDLAVSDTSVIGLIGYIWPGGLDGPTHHGVRNMSTAVINKNVEIGQLIKANFSPCNALSIKDNEYTKGSIKIYPNPATEIIHIEILFEPIDGDLVIYNSLGEVEKKISKINSRNISIETSDFTSGIYFILFSNGDRRINGKFIINK
ncbi:MAG: T9SS type A sorting domain-containing protein [Flavobacteriia bacterium]|nr:T9SS type A sorting domain-containing protein [Flavobacteriia bacterium]